MLALMAGKVRDFLLDANGDIAVINGDFAVVADAPAVKQGIQVRTQMFTGDCYINLDVGVPWREDVLIKDPDPNLVREVIGARIASVPDVLNVAGAELSIDGATREGSIGYQVDSVYGPIAGAVDLP